MHITSRLELASRLARNAGALAMQGFKNSDLVRFAKQGGDIATNVDYAIETLISEGIRSEFPEDSIFGEEFGGSSGVFTWVIDPLDGTSNFSAGIPFWCISIALFFEDAPVLGVVYDPLHDEIFEAAANSGAFCNGRALAVKPLASSDRAAFAFGYGPSCARDATLQAISDWMNRGAMVRCPGAGALAITYIAAGRLSGFYEQALYVWDWAAASVIVKEAGGWVDFEFDWAAPKQACQFVAGVPGLNTISVKKTQADPQNTQSS